MLDSRGVCRLVAAALFIGYQVQGFTSQFASPGTTTPWRRRPTVGIVPSSARATSFRHIKVHAMSKDENDKSRSRRLLKKLLRLVPFRKRILRKAKPISFAILTVLSLDKMSGGNLQSFRPNEAHASAPLPIIPKIEAHDMEDDEMKLRDKEIFAKAQKEAKEFQHRALQIQEKHGEAARKQFEKEYQQEKMQEAEEKAKGLEELKLDLLRKGISPWYDIEGERQIILYSKGIDLAEVTGTRFFVEKAIIKRSPQRSFAYEKRPHRFILKCRVEDMERRGIDPLQHYTNNKEEMGRLLDMSPRKALAMEREYRENLSKYGQITVPVEGEKIMSREEFATKAEGASEAAAAQAKESAKAKVKAEKEAAKAKVKEEKAKAKAEKAAAKARAKEEKARAKEEKAKAKEAAKAAAAAAAAGATAAASAAAAGAGAATQAAGDVAKAGVDAVTPSAEVTDGSTIEAPAVESAEEGGETAEAPVGEKSVETAPKKKSGIADLPVVPVAAFVVAAGGGYVFKVYREKAALAEEERQRQFKLIMGDDSAIDGDKKGPSFSAPALEEVEPDLSDMEKKKAPDSGSAKSSKEEPPEPVAEKPKKRRGIKSMFQKKGNDRETNLNALLAPSATAPEFASLLAKILTFGAPGRFPQVVTLPGGMPMEEFDLDASKEMLIESRASGGLTEEQSAEVFANVVNCMLIDIVDLASSTLKEKDKNITVNAINVVVDFMNHAASLYDAVAPGVTITPVTYGGTLGRGKLEQMFEAYATSPDADQGQLTLLQGVFNISDKKVEGIMMKDMRKRIMDMMKGMKDGEINPEMEEMMKAMGGMEGMAGMEGMEGMEPSPEDIKHMLKGIKDMKEEGLIPKEELKQVRKDFKASFGSDIDELMDKAKQDEELLSPEEQELLDLMKAVLED